ncbi:hypothetical protein [Streptomyces sp. NPDC048361]|uniref:hypothetical protein n=1 Tax=Streptomyces sp. NPDC048361 TaxID=3154720 RepID=UPI00343E9C96
MDAYEAREVEAKIKRLGLSWIVAPMDPNNSEGPWGVYDIADPATREPIKAEAWSAVLAKAADSAHDSRSNQGRTATRGFVVPPTGG